MSLIGGMFVAVVVAVLMFTPSLTQEIDSEPAEVLVKRTLEAMRRSVDYYMKGHGKVRTEELLGLRVATDSLSRTVEQCIKSPEMVVPALILKEMKILGVLIPKILNLYMPENMTSKFRTFIDSRLKSFRSYRSINVNKEERGEVQRMGSGAASILPLMQSCLGDLLLMNQTCKIPEVCWKVLEAKVAPEHMVTHQAMLLVQAEISGCEDKINKHWNNQGTSLDELADSICFSLYTRVSSFHQSEFSLDEDVAMFLDSFFACNLLGFEDYLYVAHMRLSAILDVQLPSGCFGFMRNVEGSKPVEDCIPRMSGAAIGLLGLYISWLLHPKGYIMISGKRPFNDTDWHLPYKKLLLLSIVILTAMLIRRNRRFIGSLYGRFASLR